MTLVTYVGIFRLSVSSSELERVKVKFDSGDYDTSDIKDPNLAVTRITLTILRTVVIICTYHVTVT